MGVYTATPRTWVADELVDASLMNSDIRDPLTALGSAMTSYTPTLSGFTPGNGTGTGAYTRFGKFIYFWAQFTFGTTSAAASAVPALTLPVTSAAGTLPTLWGAFVDASPSNTYQAGTRLTATTTVGLLILGTSGLHTSSSTTTPFTWTTSDVLRAAGVYEAA